jgi:SAM-dependent methyltransferase
MDNSLLVRLLGFPATLLHGDPLVLDRWLWLRKRLPRTANRERLIDIGCGSGTFTLGAALRGYSAVGISWDERNQRVARERARLLGAEAEFPIHDIRSLGERRELREGFEVAICLEAIEHVLDDRRLLRAIAGCLRPGGILLLTTPSYFYRAITPGDDGPYPAVEDGGHVRRGYTAAMLRELCEASGLRVEEIGSCSGFLSQKLCWLMRRLQGWPLLAWGLVLPLRILPPLLDRAIAALGLWPDFSICLVAQKPRFSGS